MHFYFQKLAIAAEIYYIEGISYAYFGKVCPNLHILKFLAIFMGIYGGLYV